MVIVIVIIIASSCPFTSRTAATAAVATMSCTIKVHLQCLRIDSKCQTRCPQSEATFPTYPLPPTRQNPRPTLPCHCCRSFSVSLATLWTTFIESRTRVHVQVTEVSVKNWAKFLGPCACPVPAPPPQPLPLLQSLPLFLCHILTRAQVRKREGSCRRRLSSSFVALCSFVLCKRADKLIVGQKEKEREAGHTYTQIDRQADWLTCKLRDRLAIILILRAALEAWKEFEMLINRMRLDNDKICKRKRRTNQVGKSPAAASQLELIRAQNTSMQLILLCYLRWLLPTVSRRCYCKRKLFCAKTLTTFAQAKRVDREGIEENGGWWTRRLVVLGPCLFLSLGDRSKTFDT